MEYPPTAGSLGLGALRLPEALRHRHGSGSPNTLPEPSCATPTNCGSTRPTHVSACFQLPVDAGTGGGGGSTGGGGGSTGGGGGGGATGGGGGSMMADAGTGGGSDAGINSGAPILLTTAHPTIGKAAGCGCDAAPALCALISLMLLRRRQGR